MKPFASPPAVFSPALRRSVRVFTLLVPVLLASVAVAEPWTGTDIGNTGAGGWEENTPWHRPPEFTMHGAGADIYGTADGFRLLHIPVTGDVVAVTNVAYAFTNHPWAKAGVMVRASLAPNSANVAMLLSPGQACSFQVRPAAGAATEVILGPRLTLPCKVKLTRTGNTFTGYVSQNGTNWTQVASRTIVLPAQLHAGFAISSHIVGTTMHAHFDQADINGSGTAPAAPTNLVTSNVGHNSADLTWNDNSSTEDGFHVYVTNMDIKGSYPELAGVTAPNVTTFHLTGLAQETSYNISVVAFRSGAESAAAHGGFITQQNPADPPHGPEHIAVMSWGHNTLRVLWDDHSNNEDGFEVERAAASTPFVRIATTAADVPEYEDTGLTAGTTYTYRVRAVRGSLVSAYSPVDSATAIANPPTPSNLVVDNPTPNSLHLSWTDNSPDEGGFIIERAERNYAFVEIQRLAPNTTSYTDIGLSPNTPYTYRVVAEIDFDPNYTDYVTAKTAPHSLPPGWIGVDIGSPSLEGEQTDGPPTFTMHAGGTDIYGTSDSFHFLSKTVTGDATIVCRIASLFRTDSWAKAGVMIRTSLDANSANVAMLLSAAQVCSFQVRTAAGATTEVTTGAWLTPPYWVKLSRVGNTFTGYVSPDGNAWTPVGSRTLALPSQVYIGFAASSHGSNIHTVATFENAAVTGSTPPPPPPEPVWTQRNWGTATGSFTEAGDAGAVASITATSGDIYGASDSGVFVYQPWSGATNFVTRVTAAGNSHAWAKAGLMIRASLEPNAANAFVALTPGTGAVFQSRSALSGAQTTTVGHNRNPRPGALLKLVRGGGMISAFFSTNDGAAWVPLGSVTDDLPETIYLGYAASSHNPVTATTATFAQPE